MQKGCKVVEKRKEEAKIKNFNLFRKYANKKRLPPPHDVFSNDDKNQFS